MADYIIPSIGSQGYYAIGSPFDRYIIPSMRYTCQAVRTLKHYVAEGQDPFALFYNPNGLDQATYDQDYLENISIVGLQADSGPIVYVPARYILSYPLTDGVAYQEMMLGVALGSLPTSLDLTALSTRIQNIVQESLGIVPVLTPVQLSATVMVTSETDARLTAARQAIASQQLSDASRVTMLQGIVDTQRQTITALEDYIRINYVEFTHTTRAEDYFLNGKPSRRTNFRKGVYGYVHVPLSADDPIMYEIPTTGETW